MLNKKTHILNNMDTFYSSSQYDENGKQCKVYSYKKNDTFIANKYYFYYQLRDSL